MTNSMNTRIYSGVYESFWTGFYFEPDDEQLDTNLDFSPKELVRGPHFVVVHCLVNSCTDETFQFIEVIDDGLWFSKTNAFFAYLEKNGVPGPYYDGSLVGTRELIELANVDGSLEVVDRVFRTSPVCSGQEVSRYGFERILY